MNVKETVATDDGEFEVSTVKLDIPHGPDRQQHYETCVFHEWGSDVVRRYQTKEEADKGHKAVVDAITSGAYSWKTVFKMLRLDE